MAVPLLALPGAFLVRSLNPDDLFAPEDLTDEQRLFGQTTAEFMRNEVFPNDFCGFRL